MYLLLLIYEEKEKRKTKLCRKNKTILIKKITKMVIMFYKCFRFQVTWVDAVSQTKWCNGWTAYRILGSMTTRRPRPRPRSHSRLTHRLIPTAYETIHRGMFHSKGAACTNSILPIIVISKVTLLLPISLHTMHSFIRLPTRVGLSHLVRSTHGFNSLNESIYKIYTFSIRNCNANATLSLWIGSYHIVIENWISGYFSKSHNCEMHTVLL